MYRPTTGSGVSYNGNASAHVPYWLKLVRTGNTFTAYSSSDGDNWTQLESTETISMAQNVYVGLVVSSYSTTSLATATFDNVQISSTSSPAPAITNLSATSGLIGSQVQIMGSGFGTSENGSFVTLNGLPLPVNFWGDTEIGVTIPTG